MAVTDPVDTRLLAALAEVGKAAVHELAAKVGMDPREVAYRLVALSGSGLPLLVGVESDPNGLRAALAAVGGRAKPAPPGAWPGLPPARPSAPPSGPQPMPAQGVPSGPHQVQSVPSGRHPVQGTQNGAYQGQGAVAPYPAQPVRPPAPPARPAAPPPPPLDPVISVWGPPQTASWARSDRLATPAAPAPPPAPPPRTGRVGDVLDTPGPDGEQLRVRLLEVQDPADFLVTAEGYRLEAGERAVVVHTEITNRGSVPFASLPDDFLELVTADGQAVAKAPVSLTSRPPHKIGVGPGETAGGHTVYVIAVAARITAVRWSPRPEPGHRCLTWSLND